MDEVDRHKHPHMHITTESAESPIPPLASTTEKMSLCRYGLTERYPGGKTKLCNINIIDNYIGAIVE